MSALLAVLAAVAVMPPVRMPIVTGHVSPVVVAKPQDPAVRNIAAVCFWQVPGQMQWVNLYSITEINVTDFRGRYTTRLLIVGRNVGEIEMPMGMHISTHTNAIMKRIAECQGDTQVK